MMHTTCLNPSVSLTCRSSRSLYLDHPICFSDARFESNHLIISSSSGCCCCADRNSIYNSLPIINPSFFCNGLRQSTLIQFSPSKSLIGYGRRRLLCDSGSRFSSVSDSNRSDEYCRKRYSFKERRRLGQGRYACRSYEDKKNERAFSNEIDDNYVDEVELLLDLLTEEVGFENIVVRDRKWVQKKDPSIVSGRIKILNSRSEKRDLKCDTKSAEIWYSEKENRKVNDEKRTSVKEGNHERKKQGSSSSYYSVSSTGEYDTDFDNNIEIEHDDYFVKGESSSEYKDDRKIEDRIKVYDEELDFGKRQSEILKKNSVGSYYENQEWRKKSEKKLDVESIQSQSQHTERISQQHSGKTERITDQFQSGLKNKNSSIQKHYSDTENKLITSVDELTSHHKEETADFTRKNEFKKQSNVALEASEIHNHDKRIASSSSTFEARMKNWQENSTKVSDQFEDQREEKHQRVDQLTSSKEARVKSQQYSDTVFTNVDQLTSSKEARVKSQQYSDTVFKNVDQLTSSKEARVKLQQYSDTVFTNVDQLTSSKESRVKSQQYSDTIFTNIENSSVSQTQYDVSNKKQELHLESSSSSENRKNIEDKYTSSSYLGTLVGPTESMKTGRKTTKASSFHVGMPKESSSSYNALKLNPESSFQESGARFTSADEQQKSAGQFVGEFVEKAKHELSISEEELARGDDEPHGENVSGNYDEKDGIVGPSDETWHESGAPVDTSSDDLVRRSGRSLWNVIGDVLRLRWGPSRSETHTPKSGGVSNQSTSSERWFSGHEESSRKDVSTPSSSKEKQDSPLLLSSSKPMSPLVIEESSVPLPAIRMRRSPVVKTTSVTGETDAFTSGKADQIIPKPLTQVPHTDASDSGKMVIVEPPIPSRRKLARTDQVSKDRFDEWEEAYNIEAKQRKNDEFFMREALSEAKKAADLWEVPVGAVLVQDDKVIARGYNLVEELRDSTAHAEMVCIREASNKLHSWRLSGTTLYVTLEPCPMCAGAILQARIDTVVWGAPNKLLGADGSWIRLFPDVGGGNGSDKPPAPVHPFHPNMIVRRGVLSSECADVMQQFFQLRRKKKDKKPKAEPPSPSPSCLPIAHHHNSKFVTKLQDAFGIMFCL